MPYPKHYVDGMLLNWGDRLFYEPLHRLSAPGTSRVVRSGSATQLRAQIARTVRKNPEVMVKITNRPGGRKGMKAISGHLRYISRNGKVDLEDQDGQVIVGIDEIRDLADEWRRSGFGIPDESRHREAFNIMLSMPPGTDRLAVHCAARDFARAEFVENHRYVFAAHNDEVHPHVHMVVQTRGHDGRRLNPRKADLRRWREGFAQHLREHGVEANATPRRTRGVMHRYARQSVVHLQKRGGTSVYEPPGRVSTSHDVLHAHRHTLEAWREIGQALATSESGPDRGMSVDVTNFVRDMPVVGATPELPAQSVLKRSVTPDAVGAKRRDRRSPPSKRPDEPDFER